MPEAKFYLGPPEASRQILGLRLGQIALVASVCLLALVPLKMGMGSGGLVTAGLIVVIGIAATWIRVHDRHLDQWVGLVVQHHYGRYRFRRPLRSELDDHGNLVHGGLVSSFLRLEFESLHLNTFDVREQRSSSFARAVATTLQAHCKLEGASWTIYTDARDPRSKSARWIRRHSHHPTDQAAVAYRELLHEGECETLRQRVVLSFTSSLAHRRDLENAEAMVRRELAACGVGAYPLEPEATTQWITALSGAKASGRSIILSLTPRWHAVTSGGQSLVATWVQRYPAGGVGPDLFADACLLGPGISMTVSLRLITAAAALRKVRSRRTGSMADATLRARAGFLESSKESLREQDRQRRESRYATGESGVLVRTFFVARNDLNGGSQGPPDATASVASHLRGRGVEAKKLHGCHEQIIAALATTAGWSP